MLKGIQLGAAISFVLLLHLLVVPTPVRGQSIESKLSQRADFIPTANTPRERLIEIAKHYRLPMGIEWIAEANEASPKSLPTEATVLEMIKFILAEQPGYVLEVRGGVANVRSKEFIGHPSNFLNLRIPEYRVDEVNVFGAEWSLRKAIHQTLHPQPYAQGGVGGYGYGADRTDGFDVKNISLSGRNLTVRAILNAIVRGNGNALWLVELVPSKMMTAEPFFAQQVYGNEVKTGPTWQIIPLRNDQKDDSGRR